MNFPPRFFSALAALGLASLSTPAGAVEDVAPIDAKPILQALKTMREAQANALKSNKQRFIQEATAAAGNSARAVELWEEAIRATQFQGAAKENAQFREWKDKEGDALKDKEVLSALHLYFNWLSLTLQRSNGVEAKTLLPAVLSHAREVQADQAAMDLFDENLKREKEAAQPAGGAPRKPNANAVREREKRRDDDATKKMHDQIVRQPLAGSAFVQWMKLGEILNEVAPARKRGGGRGEGGNGNVARVETGSGEEGSTSWEPTPGSYDGIFQQIILPELRVLKDVRVLEYWDAKLRREGDLAGKAKLAFDIDKFNTVRRPQILWSRSQDLVRIGQKNRAATDMFALIKGNPTHPDLPGWITELEGLLAPPAPAAAATASPGQAATPDVPGAQ